MARFRHSLQIISGALPKNITPRTVGIILFSLLLISGGVGVSRVSAKEAPEETTKQTMAAKAKLEETKVEIPLELNPYRVKVVVGFDEEVGFSRAFREETLALLRQRCRSYWSRMCETQVVENQKLFPATVATLERVEIGPESAEAQGWDKVFFLTVQSTGADFRVAAKVWDGTTREMSQVVKAVAYRREDIAGHLFGLLSELFEPIVEIEDFDFETVTLNVRAGEILPTDPDQAQLKPGELLKPFYRFLSREGEVQRIQEIPWTYFIVSESDRARAVCRLSSGLRIPLTTRRRRTVQALAVGIHPRYESTRLKLEAQRLIEQPLTGLTLSILTGEEKKADKDEPENKDEKKPIALMSDREGYVTISATQEQEIPLMLVVQSGKSILAKMPFVPGLTPEATVQLPDDSTRLSVEGQLAVLEADFIDLVAKIAVLKARTKFYMKKNDWEKIDELLAQFDKLEGPDVLRTRLTVIRENGVKAAESRRNKSAARRIEKLCSVNRELIDRYLDPDKMKEFKKEVEETRKALQGDDDKKAADKN